uniref:LigA n=1 Tax=Parastrongyloides trichosuri TaxID=131310 RepID=A0A0N4ZJL3_PARTI
MAALQRGLQRGAVKRGCAPLAVGGAQAARAAHRAVVLGIAEPRLAEPAVGGGDEDALARQAGVGGDEGVADGAGGQALGWNGLQIGLVQAVPHARGLFEVGLGAVPAAGAVGGPFVLLQAGRRGHAEVLLHRRHRDGRAGGGAVARMLVIGAIGPQAVQGQAELVVGALIALVRVVLARAAGLGRPADGQHVEGHRHVGRGLVRRDAIGAGGLQVGGDGAVLRNTHARPSRLRSRPGGSHRPVRAGGGAGPQAFRRPAGRDRGPARGPGRRAGGRPPRRGDPPPAGTRRRAGGAGRGGQGLGHGRGQPDPLAADGANRPHDRRRARSPEDPEDRLRFGRGLPLVRRRAGRADDGAGQAEGRGHRRRHRLPAVRAEPADRARRREHRRAHRPQIRLHPRTVGPEPRDDPRPRRRGRF